LQGLVLQNPFRMGQIAVTTMVEHLRDPAEPVEKRIDTGVHVATPENMNEPEIKLLLRPPIEQYL
jgi:ribose transport system substrate-binding protein